MTPSTPSTGTAGTAATPAPAEGPRTRAVWWIAAGFLAVELAVAARYGFHRDELYFVAAGSHPAFGYVDQPPLSPLLAHLTVWHGHGPFTIRIIPAVAGALLVLAAGRFARLFGAGRHGQVLAALGTACAPVFLGTCHLMGTTALDLLAWNAVLLCVVRAVLYGPGGPARYWLGAGAAAGLGLENKGLVALLLLALGVGLVFTGHRWVFRERWLWFGAALAGVLWLPNLLWQAAHGWPQLAMASALSREHTALADYLTVLPGHVVYAGWVGFALAVAGAVVLWRRPDLRFLVVTAALLVGYVVLLLPGRLYYDDGVLPFLIAAGGCAVERRGLAYRRKLVLLLAVITVVSMPLLLPVLPATALHRIPGLHKINYDVGETFGWPSFTAAVVAADSRLTAEGTAPTSVFTSNYGEAAALQYYADGTTAHLPPVLSGHNTYWLWGPGTASDAVVLVVGEPKALPNGFTGHFAECRHVLTYRTPDRVVNDEDGVPVSVCTGPRATWPELWPGLRQYR